MATQNLRDIRAFPELVRYLEDELDWPLQEYGFDELTFEFTPAELGLKEEDAAHIKTIYQLRPLISGQPWGIFFVEFENKKLPVVVLRRILSHLVIRKRAAASKAAAPAWHAEDLLFITAFGDEDTDAREIAFAHFHQPIGSRDLPVLRVLGWDGADTPLKLDYVARVLHDQLVWPSDETDYPAWQQNWRAAFRQGVGQTIKTTKELAAALAALAKGIRENALAILDRETQDGPLQKELAGFKSALIHDLSEESFADMYAQTITYGLFTAANSRTVVDECATAEERTAVAASDLAAMVPNTNPFLRETLERFLAIGGRRGLMDFDELGINDVVDLLNNPKTDLAAIRRDFNNRGQGEDPVIHFYESFLAAYNKKLKFQRGVFYTPQPVVSYIVRSVHELLQTEFGLEDGLASTITWGEMAARKLPSPAGGRGAGGEGASEIGGGITIPEGTSPDFPFVVILDPATGTATFLVEVISVIYRTLTEKWKKQGMTEAQRLEAWNDYVPKHLLPRLYGYELMMAPYAIAHMKIGLKLAETGYRFGSEERVRVYLTNALEPAHEVQPQLEALAPALAHESRAVANVKRDVRFTVIIGNPPYSIQSANLNETARRLVEDYKFVDGERIRERNALQFEKNLQDDYVKFIRLAEICISASGPGIVGYITNDSFLDSRSFRGMRQHLIASFPAVSILDLHGSQKKSELDERGDRDENVFDIQQGVCISLMRNGALSSRTQRIERADRLGTRSAKYDFLSAHSLKTTTWNVLNPASPFHLFYAFEDGMGEEYSAWPSLRDIVIKFSSGVKTHKDRFAYAFTAQEMWDRLQEFVAPHVAENHLRTEYALKDTPLWQLVVARQKLRMADAKPPVVTALYRPFDFRAIVYSDDIVRYTARPTMQHLDGKENVALLVSQQQITEGFAHAFVTRVPADWGSVSNKSRESTSAFPLFLRGDGSGRRAGELFEDSGFQSNFTPAFLKSAGDRLGEKPSSLREVFDYCYAILHSPAYRSRYASLLKSDFPRLPLTCNLELFRALAHLGGELVALHLLESPKLNDFITRFEGKGDNSIPKKPIYKDGAVWINASQRFEGVPEAVWNFHIGGYQVCEKWLKDRKGRTLSADDIAHYQRVVVALNETIRLMAEIDRVIETHGGWPGAFQLMVAGKGSTE